MRIEKIDLLRFIGLAMIILAHVGPPSIFFQLRNFDVPLMVLVSGMAFGLSFKVSTFRSYVWKRVKRLLFPIWIFLTLYFTSLFIFSPESSDLTIDKIITSYFLISGIGYVWIIRVFLLVALVSPFIYRLHKCIKSDKHYLLLLFILLVVYELCRYLAMPFINVGSYQIATIIIYYIVPYSLLFAFGLRVPQLNTPVTLKLFWLSVLVFIGLASLFWYHSGAFVPTQNYKYPPSIYYFSYATAVSLLLWMTGGFIWSLIEKSSWLKKVVLFIAQNSIWIYLWHIPLVKNIDQNFLIKYVLVFSIATLITYIQVLLVKQVLVKRTTNVSIQRDLKMVLTG